MNYRKKNETVADTASGFRSAWQAIARLARTVSRRMRDIAEPQPARPAGRVTLDLLHPADQSVTEPLQAHVWTEAEEAAYGHGGGAPFDWRNLRMTSQDRTAPRAVEFAWRKPAGIRGAVRYDLIVGRNRDLSDAQVVSGLTRPQAQVWHLHIATDYFWRVQARLDGDVVAESPVWRFQTHDATPRWIRVPEITNVRDLGGWPLPGGKVIRQGLVYRSSEMNGHLYLTAEGRHILENELRIRTDLDLRGYIDDAQPALDPEKVRWVHIPISPYECIGDEVFTNAYREIFKIFADRANYPVLFHCVGGADRGGTIAFLLSGLLGKSMENLIRDYEMTSLSIWGERSRFSAEFQGMLATLRRFGEPGDTIGTQVERYLESIGMTPRELAAIRDILIADREPASRRSP